MLLFGGLLLIEMTGGGGDASILPNAIWALVHSKVMKGEPLTRYIHTIKKNKE